MTEASSLTPRPVFRLALAGVPNCGKSALFNGLTGGRQKVANYPGATVERRWGRAVLADDCEIELVDLPGAYSLDAPGIDHTIAREVLLGRRAHDPRPSFLVCVVDATNLRLGLRLVLEMQRLGMPMIVALNMMDLTARNGIRIDIHRLSQELGLPVIPTVAVRRAGLNELRAKLPQILKTLAATPCASENYRPLDAADLRELQRRARMIADHVLLSEGAVLRLTRAVDSIALHPVAGPLVLLAVVFLMFQAVFSWAEAPMNAIESLFGWFQAQASAHLPQGWMADLISDGVIAGVGSVVIFLPQILLLFAFILLLEQSGYMTRAAFLMDRLMSAVGLNGRAFIPLLSSFACAIPGIMATRVIDPPRDRMTTIMIAPLMTCAARLPVFTLIIAAFIPNHAVAGGIGLQGLVMFGLYIAGILSALAMAAVLKFTLAKGRAQPLLMELPKYQLPVPRDLLLGLWTRAYAFLRRAGTIILLTAIMLWFLASFPAPPGGASEPAIYYSFAGQLGRVLETLFRPIGFNWEICIALVPGMAAREVAVAALGTVYAVADTGGALEKSLSATLQNAWTLPTALAFLAWYVYAPMCFATLAVARRETGSWKWTAFMAGYLFALAYAAAGVTYWVARALA